MRASDCTGITYFRVNFSRSASISLILLVTTLSEVTQVVKDLTFQIDFAAIALADLIEFVDHVAQVRADFLYFFISLTDTVSDNGLTLARVFKLHAFGEELSFVLVKIDFQNIVIGFRRRL